MKSFAFFCSLSSCYRHFKASISILISNIYYVNQNLCMSPLAVKCRCLWCCTISMLHAQSFDILNDRKNANGNDAKWEIPNLALQYIDYFNANDENGTNNNNKKIRSKKRRQETVPHDRNIYTLQIFARSIRSINFASHAQTRRRAAKLKKGLSLQPVNQWNVFLCCSSALLPFLFRHFH